MNDNYTIDINRLSYMELEELYGQFYPSYTEKRGIEFIPLYTEELGVEVKSSSRYTDLEFISLRFR